MKLWDLAIRQPVFMTMILLAGVVLGGYSYTRMPVDLFPNVEFPIVVVSVIYPGASPEEIEEQITSLLEDQLFSTSGIDTIQSTSGQGFSTIILTYQLDMAVDSVVQEVNEKIDLVRNRLPSGAQEPVVRRFNPTDAPVMRFGVADNSGQLTPAELRQFVDDVIKGPLEGIDGVGAAEVQGGQVREVQVNLDTQSMNARYISPQQVASALRNENLNIPAGSLIEGDQEVLMNTPGDFESLAEMESVIISQRGAPVYLRDVAQINDGFEKRETISRLNGQESIIVNVRKESGSNTLAVSSAVKELLGNISAANPNLDIAIAGDEAIIVSESTQGAIEDLLWGSLLAGIVILFFFRDLRNTIITIGGLPVIMISTLLFMDSMGIGLNQLSLLALALVVGLVIDDSIVVRENILRWIEKGYSPRVAASKGTEEVIIPVIATSATILAVFMPVAYAEGIIGRFFRDFGLTVSLAIIVSTFEALTMAPMLSAYFFRPSKNEGVINEDAGEEVAGNSWLDRFYGRILNWTIDHKFLTVIFAVGVIIASAFSAGFIEQSFLPNIDRGQFDVNMKMNTGTPLDVTVREAVKVEEILMMHPEISDVFTTIGGTGSPETASFFIKVHEEVDSNLVIDQLRGPLAKVPGIAFQLADNATGGDTLLGNKAVIIELIDFNGDYPALIAASGEVARQMASIPGIVDITQSYQEGKPEMQIDVDRQRAADLGMSTAQIGSTMRTLVNGEVVSTFRGAGTEADIRVQLNEQDRSSVDALMNMNMLAPTGQLIPLRNIAQVNVATSASQIQRVDRQPIVRIGANVSGRPEAEAVAEVGDFIGRLALPTGITAKLGGDAETQSESFRNLSAALLLSVVFIYMVLASQFASFIQPLLIMLAMPLAVIGAIMALSLTGRPLDLTAFIGFIMLMGLVTKNSILLVDFANKERARGLTADRAMRNAGPVRLRPILMTAISLILAMIPVALALGEGGEFRSSMSIAIMGGMITSTFLTLLIVPVAYTMVVGPLDRLAERRATRVEMRRQSQAVADAIHAAENTPSGAQIQSAGASDD